jgi:hypothetical protein
MGKRIFRQGDVLFFEEEIPVAVKLQYEHEVVIRSETGNRHVLKCVNVYSSASARYVQVYEPTELKHPQHPTILVRPGSYRIARVRDRDVIDSLFVPRQVGQAATRTTPRD